MTFETWWRNEGFRLEPVINENAGDYTLRIARTAWEKGAEGKAELLEALTEISEGRGAYKRDPA